MSYKPKGFAFFLATGCVPALSNSNCFSGHFEASSPLLSSKSIPLFPPYQAIASRIGALFSPSIFRGPA